VAVAVTRVDFLVVYKHPAVPTEQRKLLIAGCPTTGS